MPTAGTASLQTIHMHWTRHQMLGVNVPRPPADQAGVAVSAQVLLPLPLPCPLAL